MPLHPDFPKSPYLPLEPSLRWSPQKSSVDKYLPPLVGKLRIKVKEFRDSGYVDASDTSKSLLKWWFQTEKLKSTAHAVMSPFQYYFSQREAVETIIYLVDVAGARNKHDLMRFDIHGKVLANMFDETWRRYLIKMATGSGKTKVMSLILAWSYFHKQYETESQMARNFLLIAPNIIVLDRLAKDFNGLKIFYEDPVLPDNGFEGQNWRDDFKLTLHRQDEVHATSNVGNIFLTNIHRVHESNLRMPSVNDENTSNYFLGGKPSGATTDSKIELDQIVRDINELTVINDEAHHVHDCSLAWFKSIEDIHNRLVQKGSELSLQLDVSATPKHSNGAIFVQTVSDYPLVEAIAQDIVKHPVVPDRASRLKLSEKKTEIFTEKYADFLELGVTEWRKVYKENIKVEKKSILFVMVDDTRNCDDVAEYLRKSYSDFEAKDSVLTIHTKNNGEILEGLKGKAKQELEELRKLANEIDDIDSPYKAIVSVLMLKEGWDVRNVTTIVGLRAYSAKSNILPEQTLGRGLRRMFPENAGKVEEYVSVIGTSAFMEFVESIRAEGVELEYRPMNQETDPIAPLVIEVDHCNEAKNIDELDIEIPVLTPRIYRKYQNLNSLDVSSVLNDRIVLKAYSDVEKREIVFNYTVIREGESPYHHKTELDSMDKIEYHNVVGYFARTIMKELKLVSGYDILYSKVKGFIEKYLFTIVVDLRDPHVVRNVSEIEATKIIIETFIKAINALTIEDKCKVEIAEMIRLSNTHSFFVKNQEYVTPMKSVFNRIVGDSNFELQFAGFLDKCDDVVSHGKNYLAVGFKIDYINADGEIRNYYPDFFVRAKDGQVTIVETKGLEDLNALLKKERLAQWCEDVAKMDATVKPVHLYVTQRSFEKYRPQDFASLVSMCANN